MINNRGIPREYLRFPIDYGILNLFKFKWNYNPLLAPNLIPFYWMVLNNIPKYRG